LFVPLIKRAAELTGTSLKKELDKEARTKSAASLRVIADHSRAATFLISDGVLPSNEGRGYVLRKIIRRAITHGRLLGQTKPFLHEMVFAVRDLMNDAYPELNEAATRASKVIAAEETRFAHTFDVGLEELEEQLAEQLRRFEELTNEKFGPQIETAMEKLYEVDNAIQQSESLTPELRNEMKSWLDKIRADAEASLDKAFEDQAGLVHEAYTLAEEVAGAIRQFKKLGAAVDADPPTAKLATHLADIERDLKMAARFYPGDKAFRLYDELGMPLDFMQDAARDRGIEFDQAGFDRAMAEQRERARASWKGAAKQTANPAYQQLPKSEFEGYWQTRSNDCEVLAIINKGQGVQELKPGEEGEVILDHTPFYAEAGGQVGDRGWFYSDDHNTVIAEVKGCYYPVQGVRAHQLVVKQPPGIQHSGVAHPTRGSWGGDSSLKVGDQVDAVVNTDIREATMRNHTATHLLHAGLREVLGKHVKQAGSLVAPNHLRFDFSHFTAVEDEELQDIEDIINKEVLRNRKVEVIENVPIDVAVNEYHAMALFGEKYGDKVRVIRIGDFSTELCGGTHTGATGEIGLIKILKEGSVSSGVRRLEAVTGEGSLQHFRRDHELENFVAGLAGGEAHSSPTELLKAEREKDKAEIKRLQRELDQARMKSAASSTANIGEKVKEVKGVKVLAHRVDNLERAQMRTLVDQLRDKLGSGVVVLGSASNGNVALIVGVTKDLTSRVQAGKVIGPVAQKVGGKGGGRPDLAEAGGKDASSLDAALDGAYGVVEGLLA
jgi:alanyl-tRNA synthetase